VKDLLRARQGAYKLQEIDLVLHQEGASRDDGLLPGRDGSTAQRLPDAGGLLETRLRQVEAELGFWRPNMRESSRLLGETQAIQPGVRALALAPALRVHEGGVDTVLLAEVTGLRREDVEAREQLAHWLARRLDRPEVLLRVQP